MIKTAKTTKLVPVETDQVVSVKVPNQDDEMTILISSNSNSDGESSLNEARRWFKEDDSNYPLQIKMVDNYSKEILETGITTKEARSMAEAMIAMCDFIESEEVFTDDK